MRGRSISVLWAALLALGLTLAGCGEDDGSGGCIDTNGGVEQCDGIDNDCDGLTDEDADCCEPTNGGVEACDGIDNDCDNVVDEELTQACVANGGNGTQTCVNGAWGECQTTTSQELCDGQDNDGDGQVDEGLQRACNTACGTGIETCVGGAWVNCDAPAPESETCDGRDNNCDGQIDEGLTRTCETDCGQGEETCSLGNWFGCTAPRPAAEVCDGNDNDCDGNTDEELSRPCNTGCGEGVELCVNGQFDPNTCTARVPADAEVCDNNIDDDCNGQTDEECGQCTAGTQTTCIGLDAQMRCQTGQQVCNQAGEWGPCQLGQAQLASPTEEVCDGRDNDCDGGVDESFADMGQPCGGGEGGAPLDEGECTSGTWACVGGQESCQGARLPEAERCNDLDDDCDGETDNGLQSVDQEDNGSCGSARNKGTIPETDPDIMTVEDTLTWSGSLYPDGDVDYFMVSTDEGSDFCFPWVAEDPDYQVTVMLYNLPEGVDYDICIEVVDGAVAPDEFCGEERLLEETCQTAFSTEDGEKMISYIVETTCAFGDDSTALIKVVPHEGSPVSCNPYTISVWAETLTSGE